MSENRILKVIESYDSKIIRIYSGIRFHIIRQRFLDEVGQYLPASGNVLDIGCGFGLFSLYYAINLPNVHFTGVDSNGRRIQQATQSARKLGLKNVDYSIGDATALKIEKQYDCAYMLDIVHHVPPATVAPMIRKIYDSLRVGGRLIIKDVADKPAYKRWFTWWLDKLMDYKTPVNYWAQEDLKSLLQQQGFEVFLHQMVDYLPYPHIIYICNKKS